MDNDFKNVVYTLVALILSFGAVWVAVIVALGFNDARFIKAGYVREEIYSPNNGIWVKK